jgi:DNA repair exonuclease SbcCD nuclease subunit
MDNICVISDCHLGYRHRLKFQRRVDYEQAFKEAVEKALQCKPKILIFLGDIFHYSRPDPRSMSLVMRTLMKIANFCNVILCIGNHELEGNISTAYLPLFSELHENIHVLSTEQPHSTIQIEGKKIGLHGFEFLRNRKFAEETLNKISEEVDGRNDFDILCLHQALQNYLDPYEISIPSLKENSKKFDLILLGHVHKHQKIREIFPIPGFYVGSTERISFNESENETGFLLFQDFEFSSPKFLPVSSAPMRRIRKKLNDEKTPDEINEYVKEEIAKNMDVKCLQVTINAKIIGDYLEIKQDWSSEFENFTILDVFINPTLPQKRDINLEKIELNEEIIGEYFKKIGLQGSIGEKGVEELKKLCLNLYEKYGR